MLLLEALRIAALRRREVKVGIPRSQITHFRIVRGCQHGALSTLPPVNLRAGIKNSVDGMYAERVRNLANADLVNLFKALLDRKIIFAKTNSTPAPNWYNKKVIAKASTEFYCNIITEGLALNYL